MADSVISYNKMKLSIVSMLPFFICVPNPRNYSASPLIYTIDIFQHNILSYKCTKFSDEYLTRISVPGNELSIQLCTLKDPPQILCPFFALA